MWSPAQVTPSGSGVSQIGCGARPSNGSRCSLPSAQNPSQRPSGEKNGCVPPSVPGSTRGIASSIGRA
jgi:hypothetical protein